MRFATAFLCSFFLALNMALGNGLMLLGASGKSGALPSIDFQIFTFDVATTTHSFPNMPIGAPCGNRLVILVVMTGNTTLTSVDIGGTGSTPVAGSNYSRIYSATPSGSTATITFTTGGSTQARIAIWRACNLASHSATDTDYNATAGQNPSLTLSATADGVGVVAAVGLGAGSPTGTLTNAATDFNDLWTTTRLIGGSAQNLGATFNPQIAYSAAPSTTSAITAATWR